jgi:hypothetical protein
MNQKLELFFLDRSYKRVVYAVAIVGSLMYFSINLIVFQRESERVLAEAVIIAVLLSCISIFVRSNDRQVAPTEATTTKNRGVVTLLATLAIGGATFVAVNAKLVPVLQAKNLEERIRRIYAPDSMTSYANPEDHLRTHLEKINAIADTSYRYRIPINPTALSSMTDEVQSVLYRRVHSPETKQAAFQAYGNLASANAARDTTPRSLGYVINSVLDFTNTRISIVGNHTPIVLGDAISIQNSTVVFDGIDMRGQSPFFLGLFVSPDSNVVIRNATVEDLDLTLSGVIWVNVEFRHSRIRGGPTPFALVNVRFVDCDLNMLSGWELQEKIQSADGRTIDFAFKGVSAPTNKFQ